MLVVSLCMYVTYSGEVRHAFTRTPEMAVPMFYSMLLYRATVTLTTRLPGACLNAPLVIVVFLFLSPVYCILHMLYALRSGSCL